MPAIACAILGYGLLIAAGLLLGRALLADRARGRRRCPRCWYDMAGTPGLRCPECGRAVRSERALGRTRRRWRLAAVAVVAALLGYGIGWCTPRVQRSGWRGLVPTTALVWWVGNYEPGQTYAAGAYSAPSQWGSELAGRIATGECWQWQWAWFMHEVEAVRYRKRWPRGEPLLVSTGVPNWLQAPPMNRYTFASNLAGAQGEMPDHVFAWKAGTLHENEQAQITITAGRYSTVWPLDVTLVDKPEQSAEPVSGPTIDSAVRRALFSSMRNQPAKNLGTDALLGARLSRGTGGVPDDVAVGVVVEFRRDGQVVLSQDLCLLDSPFGNPVDWVRISNPGPPWNAPADAFKGWTVRIRGDATASLRDVKRPRYWAGEFDVPLIDYINK